MQLPPTILSVDQPKKVPKNDTRAKKPNNKSTKASLPEIQPDDTIEEPPASDTEVSSDADADDEELSTKEEQKAPAVTQKGGAKRRVRGPRSLLPPRTLETTMFDRLEKMYGPDIKRMLNVQYRFV